MKSKLFHHYRYPEECICRSPERSEQDEVVETLEYDHPYFAEKVEYHIRKCSKCGKLYSDAVAIA